MVYSVHYSTLENKFCATQSICFPFTFFFNHPSNFVSEGEVSAVKLALKSPSLSEKFFFYYFFLPFQAVGGL